MATGNPLPAAAGEPLGGAASATDAGESDAAQALVPASRPAEEDGQGAFSPEVTRLPVELDVTVPVREFRVRHLLALAPGEVIESRWNHGNDVPLSAGNVQLAWSEFEVVETRMAVRVTRLK
jgi:flagellar motor switch protein FliN/FliY